MWLSLIEFAYLRPEKFNLDRLARKARALDLDIAVTMGLPLSADVSSEDASVVRSGEALLTDAVKAVRDIGGRSSAASSIRPHEIFDVSVRARPQEQHCRHRQDGRLQSALASIWCWKS